MVSPASSVADELTVLTNIPNHHHDFFFDELRDVGVSVAAVYKGSPASEGRPWELVPEPPNRVSTNVWHDRLHRSDRWSEGSVVILSGSWATPRDVLRRAAAIVGHRHGVRVMTWGEAMSGHGGWRNVARHAYFHPIGLDAVLAIGTHAVPSYRAATRGRVPVFVFPYTTSAALGVATARPAGPPIVGAVSRLIPYKGMDLLITAVARISRDERPAVEIVGSGPLRAELEALGRRLDVAITFHGEQQQAELIDIRSRWSLTVVPSRSLEGWGLAVPESLNQGVPTLVSAHVGAADLVREGDSGAIVPVERVEDPDAWADGIRSLLARDQVDASVRARRIGEAFAAGPAAAWFRDVILRGGLDDERSFIADTWARLDRSAVPDPS